MKLAIVFMILGINGVIWGGYAVVVIGVILPGIGIYRLIQYKLQKSRTNRV